MPAATTRTPPTALFQPGEVIDKRFEVVRLLGAGGMGQVFVVKHVHLDRVLALKVLLPDLHAAPGVHERFRREALAASKLRHDNVVEVHDSGILADGTPYYTMELLEGEDLSATLAREGPLPWARVRKLSLHICRAIALAHERGIIHRDLKPANCFRMTRDGDPDHIKVLDFGIAKLVGATITDGYSPGSPHYMSPEQTRGPSLDARTDVYSLGVVLYELLSGKLPFDAGDIRTLIYAIQNTDPPPLRQAAPDRGITPAVEALVLRAMARDREDRFPTMAALAHAILRLPADEARAPARPGLAAQRIDPLGETVVGSPKSTPPDEATTMVRERVGPGRPGATRLWWVLVALVGVATLGVIAASMI